MKATPQEYFPLLKYAYEGIKEGNPNANLIGMVTSYCNLNFIKTVIGLGGDKYLDASSVHPYTWSYTPQNSLNLWIKSSRCAIIWTTTV